jgi:hypothetical protein
VGMRLRIVGIVLLVVGVVVGNAHAQSISEAGSQALWEYRYDGSQTPVVAASSNDLPLTGDNTIYQYQTKSAAKAFAASLILPGLGQLYTGSKLKAAVFFGIEVLGWAGYINYRNQGSDKTGTYEAYADQHWIEQSYWDSLQSVRGIDKWQDGDEFPHHLPYKVVGTDTVADKNHEYYENIGKYDQFIWGWDDLTQVGTGASQPEGNYTSSNRQTYVLMREDANKQYDRAKTVGIILIANHLVAAFDAAFSAKRYNRNIDRAQKKVDVKFRMVNLEDTPTPWLNVAYRF